MTETRVPAAEIPWQRRLENAAALFSGLVFLAGLGLFAYNGTFARLWADDYCYSAVTKSAGLWGGVLEWYLHSGNRFSSAAAVAVSDWFGPGVVSYLPLLFLTLAAGGWFFFLYQLKHLLAWRTRVYWLALLALLQTYFLALLAPDRLQTLYWRMGMLHYSLPLALLLMQLGLVVRAARGQNRPALPLLAGLALLAFFAGGNSETFAFLQLGFWGLALLLVLVLLRGARQAHSLLLAAAPALGALLALAVMFFSPQNADRLAVMPPPDNLWLILPVTARYVADFVFFAVRGQLTPFLVFLAASAALSWLLLPQGARLPLRSALLGLALVLLAIPLLIAVSFLPSAYAGLQYPSGRALMPAAFILIAGLGAAAFFAASLLMHRASPGWARWLSLAALLVLLAASLYPLRALQVQLQEQQRLAAWATRWDERDLLIRQSLAEGSRAVQVREVEVIWSLEDLGPDPEFWINRCAAVYYGAGAITANR